MDHAHIRTVSSVTQFTESQIGKTADYGTGTLEEFPENQNGLTNAPNPHPGCQESTLHLESEALGTIN